MSHALKSTNDRIVIKIRPEPASPEKWVFPQTASSPRRQPHHLSVGGASLRVLVLASIALLTSGLMVGLGSQLGGGVSVRFFAALLGTSSWVYVGLAFLSRTRTLVLANLLVAISIFALAVSAAGSSPGRLAAGFLLHGIWSAVQLKIGRGDLPVTPSQVFGWIAFHGGLATLILTLSS